ncbi:MULTISPECIES: YdiU family protein [unclassified Rhodococcus (in: high G+C Gram-positive bacteria)]|uniref:protein adenylyltransferase SelO n=1 Tax=unclassified Rhodococcus (in: high G+C Gram-positive bacteria) TaxID=192944 RepID=UPI001639F056|nr:MULTISPECIES: YdiU family protein [unclassified Rhodococcus (in: high G+C Gram-positive bacteria)]MBC2641954.1 YdiU family protein [Rhodococcus sp. 3A]MBC2893305.1 YdiU family protein [Rhodococcus sp. 4CII]
MAAIPDSTVGMNTAVAGLASTFADELGALTVPWQGAHVPEPRLLVLNEQLAASLGLDVAALRSDDGVGVLSGSTAPAGAKPVAMAYAGHQFGGYAPLLGDGRALLLGELVNGDGRRVDLHLKGSGRTPFSRGGDGFAVVGPMLREYLVSEAMYALGIPTTRALSVVATGRQVVRGGAEPGAVLARVAASHLRVGTFEFAVRQGDVLVPLADYAIARHYPELADLPATGESSRYAAFFEAVVEAQASLVARWMLTGFVHGVMNTDNTTISGETIDYGPCAFLDAFDPAAVFSSIDHSGRYAYGNQPAVLKWNLARLAETLLTLIDSTPDDAIAAVSAVLDTFDARYEGHFAAGMAAKLGVGEIVDRTLIDDLLTLMAEHGADWTGSFRALADELRGNPVPLDGLVPREHIGPWLQRWRGAVAHQGRAAAQIADAMDRINPLYIPRNHQLDAALRAATDGELAPFEKLLEVVTHPFDRRDEWSDYTTPAPRLFSETFQTFCGT